MMSWFKRLGCTNLSILSQKLIDEKAVISITEDLDFDIEDWCAISYGGNILHRFSSIIERRSSMINHLSTVGYHIRQSTNLLKTITKGGKDYSIHFQLNFTTNSARLKFKHVTIIYFNII